MIGLGSWKCSIHHSFFDGEATLTVREENGEYRFDTTIDGHDKVRAGIRHGEVGAYGLP